MSFNPCVIIPIFNHADTIEKTVSTVCDFNLPCIIIDDGSNIKTQEKIKELKTKFKNCFTHRLEINQGKGVAVTKAFAIAENMEFTHALQVDADGQHNLKDIPEFIKNAKNNEQALICGHPVYDESIPKARKIARNITHFWVAIETLTLHPIDSMCGFRMYPLKATNKIVNSSKIGKRMDYDTSILVRIVWASIPVIILKTKVHYPETGISHFNYIKDNWLITKMHTRLFFGMLLRSPLLVYRKFFPEKTKNENHWSAITERGSAFGIYTLLLAYKILGHKISSGFVAVVVAYFFATNSTSRRASFKYLQKIHKSGNPVIPSPPTLWTSYRHFLSFGLSALDKVSSWSGKITSEQVHFDDTQIFIDHAANKQGAMIISAHLGNIELSRALADKIEEFTMNALVFTQNAKNFSNTLKKVNPNINNHLIHVNQISPDTGILLKNKIDQGEMIVTMGDRTAINSVNRNCVVDFFNEPAEFSQGPFILASLLKCPVYLMFCLKEQDGYRIYLEPFSDEIKLSRKTRQQDIRLFAQQYAKRLEYYCHKAPFQWFNFFDIWAPPSPSDN